MKSSPSGSAAHVDVGESTVASDAAQSEHAPVPVSHDGQTRTAVVAFLVEHGPATAGDIGEELGMSAAGVRRHLDALIASGEIRSSAVSSRYAQRGRGRPAKQFQLTAIGRGKLHHAYDDLAGAAMRRLRLVGGEQAVRDFASDRIDQIVSDVPQNSAGESDPDAVVETAERIAVALTAAGFSANTRRVGAGVQICQHHCPVAHVATEFPELCEAETARFTDLLGTHVQRLATIANGDCACTTHVPLAVASPSASPSTSDAQLASATGTNREDSR